VYKTITEIVTKSTTIYSGPPSYTTVTTSFCDESNEVCIGDGSSATTGGGSGWISLDGVRSHLARIRRSARSGLNLYYNRLCHSPSYFGILVWSPVTSTITETEEVVTTTIAIERPHHHHTRTKPAPSITSSNNLDTTLYFEFPTFDKRQ
jgi:hypothetical protein